MGSSACVPVIRHSLVSMGSCFCESMKFAFLSPVGEMALAYLNFRLCPKCTTEDKKFRGRDLNNSKLISLLCSGYAPATHMVMMLRSVVLRLVIKIKC